MQIWIKISEKLESSSPIPISFPIIAIPRYNLRIKFKKRFPLFDSSQSKRVGRDDINSRINFIRDIITRVITRQGLVNWQQRDRWNFNQSKFLRLATRFFPPLLTFIYRINDCRIVPNRMSSSKIVSLYTFISLSIYLSLELVSLRIIVNRRSSRFRQIRRDGELLSRKGVVLWNLRSV